MFRPEFLGFTLLKELENPCGMDALSATKVAIVGFFFGWVIASIAQDDSAAGLERPTAVSVEIGL